MELYPWSNGLSEQEFAQAFMAASLAPQAASEEEVRAALLAEMNSGLPLLLAEPPVPDQEWDRPLMPAEYAAGWRAASKDALPDWSWVAAIPTAVIQSKSMGRQWIRGVRECLRSLGVHTVIHADWEHQPPWRWPMRIGVLSGDGSLGPFALISRHHWHGTLFHLLRARGSRQHFDVLLVDGPDALVEQAACGATAAVLLGEAPDELSTELRALADARVRLGAPMAARQPYPDEPHQWLHRLVEELAHNLPLHRVLDWIWNTDAREQPLILADRKALVHLDLRQGADRILADAERLLEQGVGNEEVQLSPRLQNDLSLSQTAPLHVMVNVMRGSMQELVFNRESEGATTLGELAAAVTSTERAVDRARAGSELAERPRGRGDVARAVRPDQSLRLLRARLLSEGDAHKCGLLGAATDYAIEVSIGPRANDWLGLPAPFPTPEAPPDDPDRGWRLRVVMWEPTWFPKPVQQELWLPVAGPSETVSFDFTTGEKRGKLGARITVLHDNRILQTGVLSVQDEDAALTWELDAAPEPQLGVVDEERWFDLSLVINNDVDGNPRATVIADNELGLVDLETDDLKKFIDAVGTHLNKIAADPDSYTDLESEDTVELLRSIAQHGFNLYELLEFDLGLDATRMAAAQRIQVVGTKPTAYFPAEFLYGYPAPDPDAVLCPGAAAALRADVLSPEGRCQHEHSRRCVCPTGFWSLSKVVERHAFSREDRELDAAFGLYDATNFPETPTVNPLHKLLFAASKKVDGFDPGATALLEQRAAGVSGGCTPIDSIDAWEDAVANEHPSLFVFLPHHFRRGTHEQFDIGPTLEVRPSQIGKELVRADSAPRPLVLLIGCETQDTRIAFDSFVQKFRRHGAAVVISTFATILGRHAAPVTGDLLEALSARLDDGAVRLGDVLLDIRRRLLADGTPMVLGLTAYGDADVTLARE